MNDIKKLSVLLLLTFIVYSSNAEERRNYTFGTSIDIPSDWSKNYRDMEGDLVYDFYSPDHNLSIQLRLFTMDEKYSVDKVVEAYEQNLLPKGSQRESLRDHTSSHGIPGKHGVYVVKHNGYELAVSIFFVKKKEKAYILSAIIPTNLLESRSDELKVITKSFKIEGFSNQTTTTKPVNQTTTQAAGQAYIKEYNINDASLVSKLDKDMGAGVTPVGINAIGNMVSIMYLNQDLFNIEAYSIDWYTDATTITNGINTKMENEGFFPMGISSDNSKFYVLYIKGQTEALAWQLVESSQDHQDVKKNIAPYLEDNYIPLGITLHGDWYYTLLVKVSDTVFSKWAIQGYQGKSAMDNDIKARLSQEQMPFGFLQSGNVFNVLYIGL